MTSRPPPEALNPQKGNNVSIIRHEIRQISEDNRGQPIISQAVSQFNWLDVSVSTAAMLPVVLGMYVGQHMRDKIAPETFKKLVLIAVIAAGAELVRPGFFG